LEKEAEQRPLALFPGDRIWAEMFLTIIDLEKIQPLFPITLQEVNYFISRQVMPVLTY
jgi:hypothetical protein